MLRVPRPVPETVALNVSPADTKTTFLAAWVSMVTAPLASIVKTSPAPPLYVICSSLAGEFWFWPTVVHVPTRQGSTSAANVALGDDVALGDTVEDPPHAASAKPADATSAITSLETIADRASARCFIANTPDFIKGVINLRGHIVPIVDLRLKLGLGDARYDSNTVVIILNILRRVVGIVVDSVSDVITLAPGAIKPAPEFGATLKTEYITGLATVGEELLILVDIERLMSSRDMALVDEVTESRA